MSSSPKPFVRIVEQPSKCAIRFRYECEGRSAGSIPGVNSTTENKSYPTIQVCNYQGKAVVVVSCVTKDTPYRPHPHNLVGKEGCKKGVCTLVIDNNPDMTCSFTSLGIQCVKRKDIEESLKLREMIKVDPFRTGFAHRTQASSIDLNVVRLCFQVFIEGPEKGKFTVQLPPIVSEAIWDKKAMAELVIVKLSHYSAPCSGGKEIIILCDRVAKDDIQVRFYQEISGQGLIWESYGEFLPNDVHKQVAISLRTPKYYDENIQQPATVQIQLRRPSDGCVSLPRAFQITPRELDPDGLIRKRHKRLKEENYDLLQEYIQLATNSHSSPKASKMQSIKTEQVMPLSPSSNALSSNQAMPSRFSNANQGGPAISPFQLHSQVSPTTSSPQQIGSNDVFLLHHPTSSSRMSPQSSSAMQNLSPKLGNTSMTYNLNSTINASKTSNQIQSTSPHHQYQQYTQHLSSTNPPSIASSVTAYSPVSSPANNNQTTSEQQHPQQQPQENLIDKFDSLEIDSSELLPELFNSNTMLSLLMDASSGLSLNDSFGDFTNNNNTINGTNHLQDGQSISSSLINSSKIFKQQQNRINNNMNGSLDIEMMTGGSSFNNVDDGLLFQNHHRNPHVQQQQPVYTFLDLDNNNRLN